MNSRMGRVVVVAILSAVIALVFAGCDRGSSTEGPFSIVQQVELPFPEDHSGFDGALVADDEAHIVHVIDEGRIRFSEPGSGQSAIYTLAKDEAGQFAVVETFSSSEHLTSIDGAVLSVDEKLLYVFDSEAPALVIFNRDGTTGKISYKEQVDLSGVSVPGRASLLRVPGRNSVVLSGQNTDAVIVAPNDSGGHEVVERQSQQLRGERLLFATDGPFIYSNSSWSDAEVHVLEEKERESGGALYRRYEKVQTVALKDMTVVSLIAMSPDQRHVYVVGTKPSGKQTPYGDGVYATVMAFQRDKETGKLEDPVVMHLQDQLKVVTFDSIEALFITASGEHAFLDVRNSLYSFGRDQETGELNRVRLGGEAEDEEFAYPSPPTVAGAIHAKSAQQIYSVDSRPGSGFQVSRLPSDEELRDASSQ